MKLSTRATRRITIAFIVLLIIIFSAFYYQSVYLPHTKFKVGGSAIEIIAPIVNTDSAPPPELGLEGEEGGEGMTAVKDSDNDGLSNEEEKRYGTDPNNPDTDGDTYKDGAEVLGGYNPKGEGRLGN